MSAVLNHLLHRDPRPIDAVRAGNLEALIASNATEIEAAQRLRYRVFSESFAAALGGDDEAIDRDVFDAFCDHLIVRTRDDQRIVGTYRILRPDQARRIGRYYCEQEFDLSALESIRGGLVELGRACVEPGFRSGPVIMLLWSALGEYLENRRCSHVIGCVSIPTWDGGHLAASIYRKLASGSPDRAGLSVVPHKPLPLHELFGGLDAVMPPLLKGYLRAGGKVIGRPHWDQQFNSADLPMLLDIAGVSPRYARRFAPALM